MLPSNFPTLSRQQLLDASRSLHENDVQPTPTGVSYHRSHGPTFSFEQTLNRFRAQEAQTLLVEADADAQKNAKAGSRRLRLGSLALLLGFIGVFAGRLEIAYLVLPAFCLGAFQIYKGTGQLTIARDNRKFIKEIQSFFESPTDPQSQSTVEFDRTL